MSDNPIKYFLPEGAPNLERATAGSSGYDLRARGTSLLLPGEHRIISTGLYLDMPLGVEAQVRSRSGLGLKYRVVILHGIGTIDADYRGEVGATLINHGSVPFSISPGDRIAQIVFAPVFTEVAVADQEFFMAAGAIRHGLVRVKDLSELSETVRGPGGYGSTGSH